MVESFYSSSSVPYRRNGFATNHSLVTVTFCTFLLFICCGHFGTFVEAIPEQTQGKWDFVLSSPKIDEQAPDAGKEFFGVWKTLLKGSQIFVKIQCASSNNANVTIDWMLRWTSCWDEYASLDYLTPDQKTPYWQTYFENPHSLVAKISNENAAAGVGDTKVTAQDEEVNFFKPPDVDVYQHRCDNTIVLREFGQQPDKKNSSQPHSTQSSDIVRIQRPIYTVSKDGIYLLIVKMNSLDQANAQEKGNFMAKIHVEMKTEHNEYLAAANLPLLNFYGVMCSLYVIFAVLWLILSFCQWRDLLRIQFWIGAVIFLGMIEMSVFYAEYAKMNSSGVSNSNAVFIAAEVISCAKRTLARMLVVVVSVGFGIVKPRLGTTFHRILVVGFVYFVLSSTEACLRILQRIPSFANSSDAGTNKGGLIIMAGVPLSLLDAGICWWIFQSLVTTTRTLRLRRNLVKLGLYRHFTNTLIFSVIASVTFMVWSIRVLKTVQCLKDWKELWLDEAFWHILFSIILLVIMVLFRPTRNNQRYSFTPLIDEIDNDDDEQDLVVNHAFSKSTMKLRPNNKKSSGDHQQRSMLRQDPSNLSLNSLKSDYLNEEEDGLDLMTAAALDSEEELISTRFELSKMQ